MNTTKHLTLNIATSWVGTKTLGPGIRSAVWVQGCPFRCPGCISPQWLTNQPARLVTPEVLASELISDPLVTGLTFSGGEPFLQAKALAELARLARASRDLNIICFSGYTLKQLRELPGSSGAKKLISQVDVLIDGPFIQRLNDNHGMRGSSNQVIHFLTDRLRGFDFEGSPRSTEIHISDGEMMFVGVPPKGVVNSVIQRLDQETPEGLLIGGHDERT